MYTTVYHYMYRYIDIYRYIPTRSRVVVRKIGRNADERKITQHRKEEGRKEGGSVRSGHGMMRLCRE